MVYGLLVSFLFFASLHGAPMRFDENSCVDGVNNLLRIDSIDNGSLPIQIRNVQILMYDIFNQTSCHEGRPNLKMPGYVRFLSGEMEVKRELDNLNEAVIQPTISFLGFYLCNEGKGRMVMPNRFCNFKWSKYMPEYYTNILKRKAVHTIDEMIMNTNFTDVQELPPSLSFLGMTLLRAIRGRYSTEVRMELEDEPIMHVAIPSDGGLFHVGYY